MGIFPLNVEGLRPGGKHFEAAHMRNFSGHPAREITDWCPKVDLRGLSLAARKLKVVRELLAWVRCHPEEAFLVGGPGDRGAAGRLRSHERPDEGHLVFRASSRRCLEVALVNGAERVLDPIEAIAFERKLFPEGGG